MILDNLWQFCGTSNGATAGITSGGQTDKPTTGTQTSSNIIDIGVGFANPGNLNGIAIPGNAAGAGARDLGIGDDPALKLLVLVTTTFTVGTSMQVNLQGSIDNGSGVPAGFTTWWSSPVYVEATLVQGARLMDMDLPRPPAGVAAPRFFQLQFISVGTHTTAGIEGCVVIDRHDQPYAGTAVGFLGGYPAGITVAN